MQIRKFRAASLATAFAAAQREMGEEAVLLHQRSLSAHESGTGHAVVEITVAVDGQPGEASEPVRPFFQESSRPGPARTTRPEPRTPRPFEPSGTFESSGTFEPVGQRDEIDTLREELGSIRRLLQRQERGEAPVPEGLNSWQSALCDSGLSAEYVAELLGDVAEVLTPAALQRSDLVAAALVQRLHQELPAPHGPLQPGRPGNPLVFALVGPTGVGKTTTLAKLATHFSLQRRVPIAFITADTFRIGAVGQLRTYSDLIQAPLEIAYTPADLAAQVEAHRDKAMIFIDTPGRSPTDGEQLEALRSFLGVLKDPYLQIALAAGTHLSDARRIIERFSILPPSGLVITKMDETQIYGPTYRLLSEGRLPVSYFTTGQRVPEDIRPADNSFLVNALIEEAGAQLSGVPAPFAPALSKPAGFGSVRGLGY